MAHAARRRNPDGGAGLGAAYLFWVVLSLPGWPAPLAQGRVVHGSIATVLCACWALAGWFLERACRIRKDSGDDTPGDVPDPDDTFDIFFDEDDAEDPEEVVAVMAVLTSRNAALRGALKHSRARADGALRSLESLPKRLTRLRAERDELAWQNSELRARALAERTRATDDVVVPLRRRRA